MKITKNDLKEMIFEIIAEQPEVAPQEPQQTLRQKQVTKATTSGATMSVEEYGNTLKQVLLTPKVTPQVRKAALEGLFGQRGSVINSLVLELVKQAQGA